MMFSGKNPKQVLIATTTFLGGLYFFLEYVLPKSSGIGVYHDQITTGVQVVGSMAVGLGVINILQVHGGKILRGRSGWLNSLALILGMLITLGVEFGDLIEGQHAAAQRKEFDVLISFTHKITSSIEKGSLPEAQAQLAALRAKLDELQTKAAQPVPGSPASTTSKLSDAIAAVDAPLSEFRAANTVERARPAQAALEAKLLVAASAAQEMAAAARESSSIKRTRAFIQSGLVESLGSAMFALLAFYIANAAYRAFRVRSIEALVMMGAALVVMLGQIPFGPLYISEELPVWRLWLIETISTPAFRAIYFGAAIAGLSMAIRMWLSLERSPLSTDAPGGNESKK